MNLKKRFNLTHSDIMVLLVVLLTILFSIFTNLIEQDKMQEKCKEFCSIYEDSYLVGFEYNDGLCKCYYSNSMKSKRFKD